MKHCPTCRQMVAPPEHLSLDAYVEREGSTRVRGFALDWEERHAGNPERFPLSLPWEEWAEEFYAYCYPHVTDDGDYLDRRFTGAVRA